MYYPIEKQKIVITTSKSRSSIMSSQSNSTGDLMSVTSEDSSAGLAKRERSGQDEMFPVDTVKQIYNDIEKLFSESDESVLTATSSGISHRKPLCSNSNTGNKRQRTLKLSQDYQSKYESCRIHFTLNETISGYLKNLTLPQYIQLCAFEVDQLDKQLAATDARPTPDSSFGDCNQIEDYFKTATNRPPSTSSNHSASTDTVTAAPLNANDLHSLFWNIFSLYEKLQEFAQNANSKDTDASKSADTDKVLAIISETTEQWYTTAMAIKDRMVTTNSFPELQSTLAAIKTQYLEQLWKTTRQLRTMVWLYYSSKMASPYAGPRMPSGLGEPKSDVKQ